MEGDAAMLRRPVDERLNFDCFCIRPDPQAVWDQVERLAGALLPAEVLRQGRPHLFASESVFIAADALAAMTRVVEAVEAVVALPQVSERLLQWAPDIARLDTGPRGALMGYDFHLTPAGPRLIEVNTNAGGAFLNALLVKAQVACCAEVDAAFHGPSFADFDHAVWDMFQSEWRVGGLDRALGVIAIVDEAPEDQFLYPEFLLAQGMLQRHGVKTLIVDPSQLRFDGTRLLADGEPVDLVYNRLVDFAFAAPENSALRQAYEARAVVVTPNPRNHALLADKRNLTVLSDPAALTALGVPAVLTAPLQAIPRTELVTPGEAERLWAGRRNLFFKPAGGHAGKAVYRGDKLTTSVWAKILDGGYIAQDLARPSERRVILDREAQTRKLDVRLYTYAGKVLLVAARVYQGQTTNFRTPGGGFAPVIILAPESGSVCP